MGTGERRLAPNMTRSSSPGSRAAGSRCRHRFRDSIRVADEHGVAQEPRAVSRGSNRDVDQQRPDNVRWPQGDRRGAKDDRPGATPGLLYITADGPVLPMRDIQTGPRKVGGKGVATHRTTTSRPPTSPLVSTTACRRSARRAAHCRLGSPAPSRCFVRPRAAVVLVRRCGSPTCSLTRAPRTKCSRTAHRSIRPST